MTDCHNCDQNDVCTYSQVETKLGRPFKLLDAPIKRKVGRPRKVKSIDPPTLPQYTDGRYSRRRQRSLLVPVELDVPQVYSGAYREWVRGVLLG